MSKWVSENKALVYTIAGVAVVVTSAGVVYYLSDSSKPASSTSSTPKKSKTVRRKEKKKAEEKEKAKSASVQDGLSPPSHYIASYDAWMSAANVNGRIHREEGRGARRGAARG